VLAKKTPQRRLPRAVELLPQVLWTIQQQPKLTLVQVVGTVPLFGTNHQRRRIGVFT
jgi:hypothetical protein